MVVLFDNCDRREALAELCVFVIVQLPVIFTTAPWVVRRTLEEHVNV